jgi:hypothetical protein
MDAYIYVDDQLDTAQSKQYIIVRMHGMTSEQCLASCQPACQVLPGRSVGPARNTRSLNTDHSRNPST